MTKCPKCGHEITARTERGYDTDIYDCLGCGLRFRIETLGPYEVIDSIVKNIRQQFGRERED
jgi:ribosomal protein L37AE/L43A